jgi:hypothetical protein
VSGGFWEKRLDGLRGGCRKSRPSFCLLCIWVDEVWCVCFEVSLVLMKLSSQMGLLMKRMRRGGKLKFGGEGHNEQERCPDGMGVWPGYSAVARL